MATIRRLSDEDVKTVFDCVHNNRLPPKKLSFKIVVVGPNGLKLSPPSFEFEDGLYILLKPQKKKSKKEIEAGLKAPNDQPNIPSQLLGHVMTEVDLPNAVCPWSLSGPQFPQPTAIQQRYCYPKGDPEYSGKKGGALWTTYSDNGKEDLEYRLLHVYYSAKRAVNKGAKATRINSTPKRVSPKKRKKTNHVFQNQSPMYRHASPTPAESVASSVCTSPLSFDIPPPSPSKDPALGRHALSGADGTSKFITPEKDGFPDTFHPVHFVDDASNMGDNYRASSMSHPRPCIRPKQSHHLGAQHRMPYAPPDNHSNKQGSARRAAFPFSMSRPPPSEPMSPAARYHQNHMSSMPPPPSYEPFPLDIDSNLFDMETTWPFNSPVKKNSFQYPVQARTTRDTSTDRIQSFSNKLEAIHEGIKDRIAQSSEADQGHLVNILSSWAKRVAQMPLGDNSNGSSSKQQQWPLQHAGNSSSAHSSSDIDLHADHSHNKVAV